MASNKRLFSNTITDSDAFLSLSFASQALYYRLGMEADDDGFIGNPMSVCRKIGAKKEDLQALIDKRFLLSFESGVVVIKHWHINNNIRQDRRVATTYKEELATLMFDDKKAYVEKDRQKHDTCQANANQSVDNAQPLANQMTGSCQPNDRHLPDSCPTSANQPTGKGQASATPNTIQYNTIIQPTTKTNKQLSNQDFNKKDDGDGEISIPSFKEVEDFTKEKKLSIDAKYFYDFNESRKWKDNNGAPIKNWQALLISWAYGLNNKNNAKDGYLRDGLTEEWIEQIRGTLIDLENLDIDKLVV